jgi:hypothetical protein
MGNQTAVIFPIILEHPDAIYTAMHTSQLQRMPRVKAAVHVNPHLAVARLTAPGRLPRVPLVKTMYAKSKEPTKLPKYEAVQFLAKFFLVVFPSRTAAVTSAVLPVKSSPPVTRVMIKPKGKPKAP